MYHALGNFKLKARMPLYGPSSLHLYMISTSYLHQQHCLGYYVENFDFSGSRLDGGFGRLCTKMYSITAGNPETRPCSRRVRFSAQGLRQNQRLWKQIFIRQGYPNTFPETSRVQRESQQTTPFYDI